MPIKLNGQTSGSVELGVPAAVSGGDVTLTLPNGTGSANQFLKNGSTAGTLEFGALASSNMPTGSILQIQSTAKVDSFSYTGSTFTDVPGLSQAITTSSASNKVLVIVNMAIGADWWAQNPQMNLVRGSTNLLQSTGGSFHNATVSTLTYANSQSLTGQVLINQSIVFLDSPGSAAAHTYKIQVKHFSINKTGSYALFGGTSTITAMEVAA